MNQDPVTQLHQFLTRLSIRLPVEYLKQKCLSHPLYPSLLSFTETLDDLGVENAALVIEKGRFSEMPFPLLIHLPSGGGKFLLIDNRDFFKVNPEIFNDWNGTVLVAEKPLNGLNEECEEVSQKHVNSLRASKMAISILCLLSLISLVNDYSNTKLILYSTAILGVFTSFLIIRKEFGRIDAVTQQLCGITKSTDCSTVLQAKFSVLRIGVKWSDLSMIYFFFLWFSLTLESFANSSYAILPILLVFNFLALPITIVSIYYQWIVIRKWCSLCLLVITLLWIQSAVSFQFVNELQTVSFHWKPFAFIVFLFVTFSSLWLMLIRPLLQAKKNLIDRTIALLRFKRSPDLLHSALHAQDRIGYVTLKNDLQLGEPDASLQIVAVLSPYCVPCSNAFKKLHELLRRFHGELGITIRFAITSLDTKDKVTEAAQYIMQSLISKTSRLSGETKRMYYIETLENWYKYMDLDKFKSKYRLATDIDVAEDLSLHERWVKASRVAVTPTVFVNGYKMPEPYATMDLPLLADALFRMQEIMSHSTEETVSIES